MAGIAVPTAFLLVAMTAFTIARLMYRIPVPIERFIVFPMAIVPNLWGVWNILYVGTLARRHFPIGVFGAVLPLILAPLGYLLTRAIDFAIPSVVFQVFPIAFPIGIAIYYLAWKFLTGSLNDLLGIA